MNKLNKFMKTLLLAFMVSLAACQQDKYPDLENGMYAEIVTDKGTILAKLEYEKVPTTVANFVSLAEGTNTLVDSAYKGKKYYNGLTFHRVLNDFMIQGGDPDGSGRGGPGYKFDDELDPTLKHDKKGILAMANPGVNANGSQFYITHKATPWLDGYDENGNLKQCANPRIYCHSVFGEVISGLEVVDSIKQTDVMKEINIIRKGNAAKDFKANDLMVGYFEEKEKEAKELEEKKAAAVAAMKPIIDDYNSKVTELPSGIKMHFINKGDGVKPKQGQYAMINYEGYFTDGRLFDSNIQAIEEKYAMLNPMKVNGDFYKPTRMQVSPDARLVQGFKDALAEMRVGDKAYIYIPYHLAYGESGRPPVIPPKTDLVFIMEMVSLAE